MHMYAVIIENVQSLQIERNKYVFRRDLNDDIDGAHLTFGIEFLRLHYFQTALYFCVLFINILIRGNLHTLHCHVLWYIYIYIYNISLNFSS